MQAPPSLPSPRAFLGALIALCCLSAEAAVAAPWPVLTKANVETTLRKDLDPESKVSELLASDTDSERVLAILREILKTWTDAEKPDAIAVAELEKLIARLADPKPENFVPGSMTGYYCYRANESSTEVPAIQNIKCDSKIDAYAYAAYWLNASNRCWRLLENIRYNKGFVFRSSVQEYLEFHQGKDACVRPAMARCQLGYCWGQDDGWGIAFRPAVEFSAAGGTGFGFENSNLGFTLSAALGARLFMFGDRLDVRVGVGIASIPVGEADEAGQRRSRSAFLVNPGIGFFNGLFGLSGIFLFDFGGHERAGKGIGVTLDIVAIKNLTK